MPEFNTESQNITLRDALLTTFTLAQNDLGRPRILAINLSVLSDLIDEYIVESPELIDGLTLAKANIDSARAFFSSIDEPVSEGAE